jgi:hypothetical protein
MKQITSIEQGDFRDQQSAGLILFQSNHEHREWRSGLNNLQTLTSLEPNHESNRRLRGSALCKTFTWVCFQGDLECFGNQPRSSRVSFRASNLQTS